MTNLTPIVHDNFGFPVGMSRVRRIEQSASAYCDASVYALLAWCYTLGPSPLREDLITGLSVRLMLSAARTNPADPTAVRWIDMDWDADGLAPTRLRDATGAEIDHELVDRHVLLTWVSNLRDPLLVVTDANPNGPITLDTHQFGASWGHYWAAHGDIDAPLNTESLYWLAWAVMRSIFLGPGPASPTNAQWADATELVGDRQQLPSDASRLVLRQTAQRHIIAHIGAQPSEVDTALGTSRAETDSGEEPVDEHPMQTTATNAPDRAQVALIAWSGTYGLDLTAAQLANGEYDHSEVLGDFLADILHLFARHDVDTDEVLHRAWLHYSEEAPDVTGDAFIIDSAGSPSGLPTCDRRPADRMRDEVP